MMRMRNKIIVILVVFILSAQQFLPSLSDGMLSTENKGINQQKTKLLTQQNDTTIFSRMKGTTTLKRMLSSAGSGLCAGNSSCWTLLFYISADNDLEQAAIQDVREILKGIQGQPSCNCIFVQIDRHQENTTEKLEKKGYSSEPTLPTEKKERTGAVRYKAVNGTLQLVKDLGEVNMGSAATLYDFLNWGRKQCPKNKVALIIWDHGHATGEYAEDKTVSSKEKGRSDALSVAEIQAALKKYKKVAKKPLDLVVFDTCYSAIFSTVAALGMKNLVKYFVGFSERPPWDTFDYSIFLKELARNPCKKTPQQLAKLLVKNYVETWKKVNEKFKKEKRNISKSSIVALNMTSFPKMAKAFKVLLDLLTTHMIESSNKTVKYSLARAFQRAYEMTPKSVDPDSGKRLYRLDLITFLENLMKTIQQEERIDPTLKKKLTSVLNEIIKYLKQLALAKKKMGKIGDLAVLFPALDKLSDKAFLEAILNMLDAFLREKSLSHYPEIYLSWLQLLVDLLSEIFTRKDYDQWIKENPLTKKGKVRAKGSIDLVNVEKPRKQEPVINWTEFEKQAYEFYRRQFIFNTSLKMYPGYDDPDNPIYWGIQRILARQKLIEQSGSRSVEWKNVQSIEIIIPANFSSVSIFNTSLKMYPRWSSSGWYYYTLDVDFYLQNGTPVDIPYTADTVVLFIPYPEARLHPTWQLRQNLTRTPLVGDLLPFEVTLYNLGLTPQVGGYLEIIATNSFTGEEVIVATVNIQESLNPGYSWSIPFNFTASTPGIWELDVRINDAFVSKDINAPLDWNPFLTIVVEDPSNHSETLTAKLLVGTTNETESDLFYFDSLQQVNITERPLYLLFQVPGDLPVQDFSFLLNLTTATSSSTPLMQWTDVVTKDSWIQESPGVQKALIPLSSVIPASLLTPGVTYRFILNTTITADREILMPEYQFYTHVVNSSLPDLSVWDVSAFFDSLNQTLHVSLQVSNIGNVNASSATSSMFLKIVASNGSTIFLTELSGEQLPDIPSQETIIISKTVNLNFTLDDGCYELFVYLGYESATQEGLAGYDVFCVTSDDTAPFIRLVDDSITTGDLVLTPEDQELSFSIEAADNDSGLHRGIALLTSRKLTTVLFLDAYLFEENITLSSSTSKQSESTEVSSTLANTYLVSVPIGDLSPANYTLTLMVMDWAGNVVSTSFNFTLTFRPFLSSPDDIIMTGSDSTNSLTWLVADDGHGTYQIFVNGSLIASGWWNGVQNITISLSTLSKATYNYTIVVVDNYGFQAMDSVFIFVQVNVTSTTGTQAFTSVAGTATSKTIVGLEIFTILIALAGGILLFRREKRRPYFKRRK